MAEPIVSIGPNIGGRYVVDGQQGDKSGIFTTGIQFLPELHFDCGGKDCNKKLSFFVGAEGSAGTQPNFSDLEFKRSFFQGGLRLGVMHHTGYRHAAGPFISGGYERMKLDANGDTADGYYMKLGGLVQQFLKDSHNDIDCFPFWAGAFIGGNMIGSVMPERDVKSLGGEFFFGAIW